MVTIYHNPRCRKSREALQLIEASKNKVTVIEYLKEPPGEEEFKKVLKKLGLHPLQVIRKQEQVFKDRYHGKELSENEWIKIMTANPILIERPIVIKGQRAVIGRPPSKVLNLI